MPQSRFSRRKFIASASAFTAAMLLGRRSGLGAPADNGDILRAFVVSDAHFGWKDPRQPSVEQQTAAMANIISRFPNLDLFLDTGDGHHNYASDAAYGNWTDVILRGCGPQPFYFTMGNHEDDWYYFPWDPEAKTARMASVGCRPYYSFDRKGIHFLVLPNLVRVNFVSREALEWAALDLEINRGRTVIILSHNALWGTTGPDNDAYRVISNSQDVYDLMNRHGGVIAWMHGHNHDFKIVPRPGRLYVSNGRIGGFYPVFKDVPPEVAAKPHLGGMYIEVHPDRFVVRSYSATEGKFFDEMPGCSHLSSTLTVRTSFDANAPARHSYGGGNLTQGARLPAYQYHAGPNDRELHLASIASPVLNDNSDFATFGKRIEGQSLLPGFEIRDGLDELPSEKAEPEGDPLFVWDNPGITLQPRPVSTDVSVVGAPGISRGKRSYYRIAPGQTLNLLVNFGKIFPGAVVTARLLYASSDQTVLGTTSAKPVILQNDGQSIRCSFKIPDQLDHDTIYTNPASDFLLNCCVEIALSNIMSPVEIGKLEISLANDQGTSPMALNIDGHEFKSAGTQTIPAAAGSRELVEASGRGIFLIRETPLWQTRNAPVVMKDGALHIGKLRNDFSPKKDVTIAPMQGVRDDPYVYRLGGLAPAVIQPYDARNRKIQVTAKSINGSGEIEVVCQRAPSEIKGGKQVSFANGRLLCRMETPGTFEAVF